MQELHGGGRTPWPAGPRPEKAEARLREVRRCFLDAGLGYDASLVALDLARLYLQAGRKAEVRAPADEMLTVFLSHDLHHHALAALGFAETAA